MRLNKRLFIGLAGILLFILLIVVVIAAVEILTGDSFTSVNTITSASNALGQFDGSTASIGGNEWRGGDTATWTVSDFGQPGTVTSVQYSVRMRGSGWGNDNIAVQYSNDSGTTWFTSQSGIQTPGSLTIYGNYTVTSSFRNNQSITDFHVRVIYTQNQGPDNPTIDFDGVEVYVTYTPPDTTSPDVLLNTPLNFTWVTSSDISFNFTPTDDTALANCTLYINQTVNKSNETTLTDSEPNYINITVGADEDYLWNVTCYDTSGNAGTNDSALVVRVDTTEPQVQLMSPDDDSISTSSTIVFSYNVSDRRSVSSCELVVDDSVRVTDNSITKDTEQTFQDSLVNGDHAWYVNCTDASTFEGQSQVWNISVQVPGPIIVTNSSGYEQGETVGYEGENWQDGANVSINVTLTNGSYEIIYTIANSTGEINASQSIDFDYPIGTYLVNASQVNDSSLNASTTFGVVARAVTLTITPESGVQGTDFLLRGLGLSPDTNVNLTINVTDGTQNNTVISANSTGGFTFIFFTNTSHPTGVHNASAVDLSYSNLEAFGNFTVMERVPDVETNKTTYVTNETMGITGTLFSELATVVVQFYDTDTGALGPEFPDTVFANSTGGFNYSWFANNTCSGNYTVLAEDQNDTTLEANTTFLIDNQRDEQYVQPAEGVTGNRVTPSVSLVNESDGSTQNVGLSATFLDGYLEFSFLPDIPDNASFSSVNVTIEHQRTSTKVNSFQMYIVEAGQVTTLTGTGCSGTPPDALGTTTCDVTSEIDNNVTKANNLNIRVNYTRSGGGGGDVDVDYAVANYSWTGDFIGCFEFGNEPVVPSVFSMATSGPVVLNAGTVKSVECNFTVSDGNGADEISGANATFFTSPANHDSPDDPLNHYTNSSCLQIGITQNSKDFSCTAAITYYAKNGTWTCNATGTSVDGIDSNSIGFQIDPLYALNVTDTFLDFGDLETGQVSQNITENVTNIGNQMINVTVYGYGAVPGDGLAFNCSNDDIPIENTRFSSSIAAAYDGKKNLSSVLQHVLSIAPQTDPVIQENTSYWQTRIPGDLSSTGICNGTIVFHAQAFG